MPTTLTSIPALSSLPGPIILAIGVFDGIHLGHQAVLNRALTDARTAHGTPVAVTFDPHPAKILRPGKTTHLLTATPHKLRLIQSLGIETTLVIPFTPDFAATPPHEFVRDLHTACRPLLEICVGHEWCFGRARAGNLELLRIMGDQLGFREVGVPAVQIDGQIVSSTAIRTAIEQGNLAHAARLLGRPYTILGTVIHGQHLGQSLGFPTANISAHNEQFPPNGVYLVTAQLNHQTLHAVANLGTRPTVTNPPTPSDRHLELHILDFTGDIYNNDIEITFHTKLREEQKFDSLTSLKTQITQDIAQARHLLSTQT